MFIGTLLNACDYISFDFLQSGSHVFVWTLQVCPSARGLCVSVLVWLFAVASPSASCRQNKSSHAVCSLCLLLPPGSHCAKLVVGTLWGLCLPVRHTVYTFGPRLRQSLFMLGFERGVFSVLLYYLWFVLSCKCLSVSAGSHSFWQMNVPERGICRQTHRAGSSFSTNYIKSI